MEMATLSPYQVEFQLTAKKKSQKISGDKKRKKKNNPLGGKKFFSPYKGTLECNIWHRNRYIYTCWWNCEKRGV